MTKPTPSPTAIAVRVARAAEMLDCSRQQVYNMIEAGQIRGKRIAGSRSLRVPVEDIYAVLDLDTPDVA